MEPIPCRYCKSTNLRALYASETGEKWVGCDSCGNASKPIISNSDNEIIDQWNKEQELKDGN